MAYQEEERTRLRRQSGKQAIALAMEGRWQEAVAINRSLVESFPHDVDAYNRLGRAYIELGEYSLAKEAYEKAMELDPYNIIAQKNVDRLSHLAGAVVNSVGSFQKVEPYQFIEEVGKAGVVNLYRLAQEEILARTVAGSRVDLQIDGFSLIVRNSHREYLGQVEPKHGQRLIKLMEGGNRYTASIISSTVDMVTVIIREVYQDPSQAGRLSFPLKGTESYRPYVGDRMLRRELENEEELADKPGYTVIGGEEAELLTEDSADIDDETEDEE